MTKLLVKITIAIFSIKYLSLSLIQIYVKQLHLKIKNQMRLFRVLKQMDVFGALLFQKVDQASQIHKSVLGGLISILLFSLSLMYTIYEFYQWNTYQLSPKISTSNYASNFELLDLKYDIVKFHFWKDQRSVIDPFENNILIPMISYTQNYTIVETKVLNLSNETSYQGNQYIIPEMKIGFSNINGSIRTTSEMFIFFVKCQQELIRENEQCASQELIDEFFSQPLNTISIQLHYKQIDSKDASISQSIQELLIQVERESCYTLNTYLQTNYYQIKNSFLFGQAKEYEFVSGVQIQPQTNSLSYCQQAFEYETYGIFFIEMNGNQIKTIMEYPNLGDVLANIGSIIQVLFMSRFIINQINSYLQHQQIIHQLISFYYPQFQNIKIFKNWNGKIIKVNLKNQELDIQEFLQFYNNIEKQMKQKLTLLNIIYEISRLYLLIRSNKSREEISRCHQIGIPLNLRNQSINNELEFSPRFSFKSQGYISITPTSQKVKVENFSLNSLDVNILSLTQSRKFRQDNLTEEISFEEHKFYDLNKIIC